MTATWLLSTPHRPATTRLSQIGEAQLRNAERLKTL